MVFLTNDTCEILLTSFNNHSISEINIPHEISSFYSIFKKNPDGVNPIYQHQAEEQTYSKKMKLFRLFTIIIMTTILTGCPDKPKGEKAVLTNYRLRHGPIRLTNTRNASGLTYNPDTGTLFLIEDSPVLIHEIDLEGNTLREIDIDVLNDTEGIVYLGNNQYAIAEESNGSICFLTIRRATKALNFNDTTILNVTKPQGNNCIEGITHDPKNNCLYLVKEMNPKKIFKVCLETKKVEEPWDLEKLDIEDASGICHDPRTGHLLILSHESRCIVECTVDGKELTRFSLKSGQNRLKKRIKKPEGIAINPEDGTIFICSEKNKFYIYTPKGRQK